MIVAMLLFFFYKLTGSFTDAFPIVPIVLPIVALVGIAVFGIFLAFFDLKNLESKGVWKFE
jgi:mannose/fructose/N-acetylgalactosamine-specific phosphotransferase system component IIC